MTRNIKITAKQIRFVFDSGKVWAILPLHINDGVPPQLRGYYSVPLAEQRKYAWGLLDGEREERFCANGDVPVSRRLREVSNGGILYPTFHSPDH